MRPDHILKLFEPAETDYESKPLVNNLQRGMKGLEGGELGQVLQKARRGHWQRHTFAQPLQAHAPISASLLEVPIGREGGGHPSVTVVAALVRL